MSRGLRSILRSFVLVLPLACAACAHDYMFTPQPQVGRLSTHPLKGKRIALDLSRTPDVFDTSANGHSFHIFGIHQHVTSMITSMFGSEMVVKDAAAADDVLALELNLQLSSALFGTEATAVSTWRIRDRTGKVIGEGTARSQSSAATMSNGGRNCEIATIQSLSQALDAALAKL